ncbi:DUF6221 family protein [Streptomyces sp. NPDC058718]|uniref:DUF6221 family protein n=1 Tax=Streptomyces sp. NPDC058718 TaxID=3346610 RepID=UPI003699B1FF
MDDLIAFLRARLDDDEQTARGGHPDPEDPSSGRWIAYDTPPGSADRGAGPVHLVGAEPETPSRTGGMDWAVCEAGQGGRASGIAAHIARHDPARVLTEVDAKRQIAREHGPSDKHTTIWDWPELGTWCGECGTDPCRELSACPICGTSDGCRTLRLLALPFADHPDYREEWRP